MNLGDNIKNEPEIINLQPINYLIINVIVVPYSKDFLEILGILYVLNDRIKSKAQELNMSYDDFGIEAIWSLVDERKLFNEFNNITGKLMLKLPLFVNNTLFNILKEALLKEHADLKIYLEQSNIVLVNEAKAIQMFHYGVYNKEHDTIKRMEDFATKQGLRRKNKFHHEIYLDLRAEPQGDNYQSILRIQVI